MKLTPATRRRNAHLFALRAPNRREEEELQEHVATMLQSYLPPEIDFQASMNGLRLDPRYLRRMKAKGALRKGWLDLDFHFFPDGSRRSIELKTETGVPTPEQKRMLASLGDRGAVCRSWDEVKAALTAWMVPMGLRWLTDAESVRQRGIAA